jgi:hypothetical protein
MKETEKVSRTRMPTWEEEKADRAYSTDPANWPSKEEFHPTFHPRKQVSIADQDLIQKMKAAARSSPRESFFDPPLEQKETKDVFVPPPPEIRTLKSFPVEERKQGSFFVAKRIEALDAATTVRQQVKKSKIPVDRPLPKTLKVIPLTLVKMDQRNHQQEEWVIRLNKEAIEKLRPGGKFTSAELHFDHKPTEAEFVDRTHISQEKLSKCFEDGLAVIEAIRSRDQLPPPMYPPFEGH